MKTVGEFSKLEFVSDSHLSAIKSTIIRGRRLDAAVAFWGNGAVKQLELNKAKVGSKIICNLFSSGCNPHEIQKLYNLKRFKLFRHDGLHAKVYLTDNAVCVGSSNVSDAGLGFGSGKFVRQREANILTDDRRVIGQARAWFDKIAGESIEIKQPDIDLAKTNYKPGIRASIPELTELAPADLKRLNIAVLVWALKAGEAMLAAAEKTKEELNLLKSATPFFDNLRNAKRYPYGKTTLEFEASVTRKLQDFQGVVFFEFQDRWEKAEGGLYTIWGTALKQKSSAWHIPGATIKISGQTIRKIAKRIEQRGVQLRYDLHTTDPHKGFVTWEPLHELLASE